ncbi:MAG: DUF5615 family PIN-like protein [Saprospiraceae bacterium]|nr:DUF5615 family PIN-like protein [Saprospiraceae bacterium]
MVGKYKIDEHLPVEVADLFRALGADAMTIHEQEMSGFSDEAFSEVCKTEGRAIVTLDIGFTNIIRYPPQNYGGIVVLRLKKQDKMSVLAVFERHVSTIIEALAPGELWIIEENRIRVR